MKTIKKATVVGAGLMGLPLIWALDKLGFSKINILEKDAKTLVNALNILNESSHARYEGVLIGDMCVEEAVSRRPDVDIVVSCAPYELNEKIAHAAIVNKLRYCDLGGNPDVSERIQQESRFDGYNCDREILLRKNPSPVFTDLGLAPGLVNIIAEYAYQESSKVGKVITVKTRCGGLPAKPAGTLKYARVFNTQGLTNEYSGKCKIIRNGEFDSVDALTEIDPLYLLGYQNMECFHTKGGLSTSLELMKKRGVKNLDYKTIRYDGHVKYIKFLFEITKDHKAFNEIIERICPITKEDIVFIKVFTQLEETLNIRERIPPTKEPIIGHWNLDLKIEADEQFTAMQKGTSFPTAVVANLMAEGEMDGKAVLDYSDVPLENFRKTLSSLGIVF